ncbi:hypothetical protein ACFOHK_16195 [Falsigemmobacter intermedius]|uniref:Glycosyltransferase family 1 protein n=1 Tax=Falsigemmobacter intermedius TaxID=1553448 RepID=A0A3S3XYT3_9RHOB|nr:hypothetical protein [Falsigemmobacter intermedius]RWY33809.1 hypothetical protein EP867_19565 [Falsigemmobacter intermedius]
MRKVAVINHDFSGFTGSEIVTLEIANYFSSRGCQVVIRAERYSDVYLPYLAKNVTISDVRIDVTDFDVVWSQHGHFALNTDNLSKLKSWNGVYIASHLSSITPAEVYHYPFSAKYAGGIIFNAEQVEKSLIEKYKPRGVICNFKNAAPQRFHSNIARRPDNLKNLLIVSNHFPAEIEEALRILQEKGVNYTHLGVKGTAKLIDPCDVQSADAIISIGKTVQYSLVGGCPVYCYDHFGGPGWITSDNFYSAEVQNFSGRCTPYKKNAELIADEVLSGYKFARDYTENNIELFQDRYNLEKILDDFLRKVEISGCGNNIRNQEDIDQVDLMRGALCHVGWIWHDVFLKDFKTQFGGVNDLLEEKIKALQDERDALVQKIDNFNLLHPSWIVHFLRSPWRVRHWNRIRRRQRKSKAHRLAGS